MMEVVKRAVGVARGDWPDIRSERKEETSKAQKMVMVHLDWLLPYQGTTRDEWPQGGSSGSGWGVTTLRTEPRGRDTRPIIDVTNTALGKEEMAVHSLED
jgi:hypothetical protein